MNIRAKINNISLSIIVPILLLMAGCSTSRSTTKTGQTTKPVIAEEHTLTPSEMVAAIQRNQPAFQRAHVSRMTVAVDFQGRQMQVKATCKLVSDSALHLSVQPFFGVELFKLEMTPAGLLLIDKANRRFYESNYGVFREKLDVTLNYDVVQSLISNRLFVAVKKAFLPDDFAWKNDRPHTLYVQSTSMTQELTVDLALARITEIIMRSNDGIYSVMTTYDRFKSFDGMVFPEKIQIDGTQSNGRKASFHFTIEDVRFDTPFVMEPTNLSRYTRGDIQTFFAK